MRAKVVVVQIVNFPENGAELAVVFESFSVTAAPKR
jgi:hypothetical protein